MQKFTGKFLYFLSFILIAALSVKSFREPDLWWQIRTGEWILQHKQIPVKDIFSFTQTWQNWINIKWGYEVLAAFISQNIGPESVFILQIICSLLILYFIKKIFSLFEIESVGVFFVSTIVLLFGIEYRIIGRPEMISHLMVVVHLYLILLFLEKKSKFIFLLIPLQILWCNMHEAYAIGIVMIFITTIVGWFNFFFFKNEKPLTLSLISLLSVGAICINPRGVQLISRAFNIFNQVQENKYTTELDNIFSTNYWHKESYLFIVLSIAFIYFFTKDIKNIKRNKAHFPLEYYALTFAFLFLSFTAYRNIVFFFIAFIPLLAYHLQQNFKLPTKYNLLFCIIGVMLYFFIVSNKYYEISKSRDRFGLEVLSTNNPVGAGEFVLQKGLKSKKCFSDYLTSSYLLWALQPDFKTYIDLRDLDVFSTAFFDNYLEIINNPQKFHTLDSIENFQYAVLFRKYNEPLHRYLYNDSIYACTYVDAVAAIYEKTDDIPSGDIFAPSKPVEIHTIPWFINKLFNPFYTTYDYEKLNYDFEAAGFYTNVGKISLAEKRINSYLQVYPNNAEATELKNQINQLKAKLK